MTILTRGTKVRFLGFTTQGNVTFRPGTTHIWGHMQFPDAIRYLIEHPDGKPKKEFIDPDMGMTGMQYMDKALDDKKTYIFCFENDLEVIAVPVQPETTTNSPTNSELPTPNSDRPSLEHLD